MLKISFKTSPVYNINKKHLINVILIDNSAMMLVKELIDIIVSMLQIKNPSQSL
ncbi:hypothetical protein HMPREF1983_00124 [Gemella bergeri ATCC 700627]|uniref:Uncharacterized protein n=1 Tax=Gemella bergeri ATCC 700627 TaxID=1321820 RepID=U2SCS1_9BACL|nr:hypothetical protein HMPREF1983_00124 [Gemella bergeri ATCC 700627]